MHDTKEQETLAQAKVDAITKAILKDKSGFVLNVQKSRMELDEMYWVLVLEDLFLESKKSCIWLWHHDTETYGSFSESWGNVKKIIKDKNENMYVLEELHNSIHKKAISLILPDMSRNVNLEWIDENLKIENVFLNKDKSFFSLFCKDEKNRNYVYLYEMPPRSKSDALAPVLVHKYSKLKKCQNLQVWHRDGTPYGLLVDNDPTGAPGYRLEFLYDTYAIHVHSEKDANLARVKIIEESHDQPLAFAISLLRINTFSFDTMHNFVIKIAKELREIDKSLLIAEHIFVI